MKTLILNDLHLGVKRQAGTTKQTRIELSNWMIEYFSQIILEEEFDTVLVLGDLFDKRNVEEHIMLKVINLFKGLAVSIVQGNHDIGGINDHTMSSAEFVARASNSGWLAKPTKMSVGYIIPHLHDQEEFDKAIQSCPGNTLLFTHCNIDSPFAHGDHSLNLTLQQIKSLDDRGVKVIAAHEHTKRKVLNVEVLGNQFPSSIADCKGGDKFCHILENGVLTPVKTWEAGLSYYEGDASGYGEFINITGECSLAEYPGVVSKVADIRKSSEAFIVKNSVKVLESSVETSEETVTQFNIIEMLLEEIDQDYVEDIKSCI